MAEGTRDRPNAVAEIAIWRETLRKEQQFASMSTHFSVSKPEKMTGISEKPTRMDPRKAVDLNATEKATAYLNTISQVKNAHEVPNQKFALPMTTAQEYGWLSQELLPKRQMFNHTKVQCDVTEYADSFYEMTGRSPYAGPGGTGA